MATRTLRTRSPRSRLKNLLLPRCLAHRPPTASYETLTHWYRTLGDGSVHRRHRIPSIPPQKRSCTSCGAVLASTPPATTIAGFNGRGPADVILFQPLRKLWLWGQLFCLRAERSARSGSVCHRRSIPSFLPLVVQADKDRWEIQRGLHWSALVGTTRLRQRHRTGSVDPRRRDTRARVLLVSGCSRAVFGTGHHASRVSAALPWIWAQSS